MQLIKENYLELTPAYNRDYADAKAAKQSFMAGQDWRIASTAYGGKLTSIRDFAPGLTVVLFYSRLTKSTTVRI
jgi:hypothetical protein